MIAYVLYGGGLMIDIAICDDDIHDLKILLKLTCEICDDALLNYKLQPFTSAKEMLNKIENVDIGILDISMAELNGIDLGRKLREKFPFIKLIYTTSYEAFCMQAINEVHAFSFLCKPIEKEKLRNQIVEIAAKDLHTQKSPEKVFYNVTDQKGNEKDYLKLRIEEIFCFEYLKSKRKIAIRLENMVYEYPYVFEKLSAEMKDDNFVVSCRGNLVNLRHITKIKGYVIYLDNGATVPLSQKRAAKFKEQMNHFIQNN
jgi:DNA-binding LytR/AlgR family response regulator